MCCFRASGMALLEIPLLLRLALFGCSVVFSYLISILSGDDLLRKFWVVEELHTYSNVLSVEEMSMVTHFYNIHHHN